MKKNSKRAIQALAERESTIRDISVGQVLTLRICRPPPTILHWPFMLSDEDFYWYEDVVVGEVIQYTRSEQYEEFFRRLPEKVHVPPGYVGIDAEGRKRFIAVTTPERPTLFLYPSEDGTAALLGAWFFGMDHKRRMAALTNLDHLLRSIRDKPLDVPLV
ncbi:hypothetical protein [Lysobacter antibioticus]|uniref:hypothetical protein n=1 Tax=Lysobacter antibioticus TaxID=84531 RepID=UPI0007166005|nr:hypothetical protein [Lysobacter antibioticus]